MKETFYSEKTLAFLLEEESARILPKLSRSVLVSPNITSSLSSKKRICAPKATPSEWAEKYFFQWFRKSSSAAISTRNKSQFRLPLGTTTTKSNVSSRLPSRSGQEPKSTTSQRPSNPKTTTQDQETTKIQNLISIQNIHLSSRTLATAAPSPRGSSLTVFEWSNLDNFVPGPGNYQDVSSLSKVGKYILSNHSGGTKAIFDHSKRITKFDQVKKQSMNHPGPGSYRMPSEFGQYDGEVYANITSSRYSKRLGSRKEW